MIESMQSNAQNNSQDVENLFTKQLIDTLTSINPPESPFENINFFSRILFFWVSPLIKNAIKKPLTQESIFELHKQEKSENNLQKFNQVYIEKLKDTKISNKIRSTLFSIYKISSIIKLKSTNLILQAFLDPERGYNFQPLVPGLILLLICYIISSLVKANYNFYYSLLCVRMTGALSMVIFEKTLKFPMLRNQMYKIGDILNMIQVDILQIVTYVQNLFTLIFVAPFIVVAFYLCYDQVKNFSIILIMTGCTIIFFGISLIFGRIYGLLQKKFMHQKDLRMRSLEEMMRGIKTIKYNSLENFFDLRLKERRNKELKQLRIQKLLLSLNNFIQNASSTLLIFIIACTYGITSLANFLTISSGFHIILNFLTVIPASVSGLVVGQNSMSRVNTFLVENFIYKKFKTDINPVEYSQQNKNESSKFSLILQNGNFSWKNQLNLDNLQKSVKLNHKERQSLQVQNQQFQFKNLNFQIKKGDFVVFYGEQIFLSVFLKNIFQFLQPIYRLGNGKSSILQAILGEMEVEGGQQAYESMVEINGSISLCSQDPWIIQDTVQENILFGQSYDSQRYQQVLRASCLQEDIHYFIDGDQTNIGENGETLSGGQRKRINLARSLYREADIYFLDDPLSALDIRVATFISRECLEGLLKNKTRIIFTSNLVGMQNADKIYLLKNGEIINEGNYNFIQKHSKIVSNNKPGEGEQEENKIEEKERNQSQRILKKSYQEKYIQLKDQEINYTKKLIQQEEILTGQIKLDVFKQFIKNLGGIFFILASVIIISGFIVTCLFSRLVLLQVSEKSDQYKIIITYCILDIIRCVSILLYEYLIVFRMISLSRYLHKSTVFLLLRASFTKFYNLITTGRIMNRLSKDIYQVDLLLPQDLQSIFNIIGSIINTFTLTIMICPPKIIPVSIISFLLCGFISYYFLLSKRQVIRIEAASKSPILQYFSEVIRGVIYLRNCVQQSLISQKFQDLVDLDLRNQIALNGIQYWFECITTFIGFFPLLISVIVAYYDLEMNPNIAIMIALQVSDFSLCFIIFSQNWVDYETHMVNYERCLRLKQSIISENYISNTNKILTENRSSSDSSIISMQQEVLQKNSSNSAKESFENPKEFQIVSQSIQFQEASFKYRADIPNCLSNLNLLFEGKQKIGIVGRTGAGKTSITLALTKVIDLVEGDLLINGKNIQNYSLSELRETVSVVSQEPYIFEGSLKLNLDPYHKYNEQDIINVYTKCGFSNCNSFKQGLDTKISQLGDNLSEGEKQLISIGRVILKNSKIIIVDEPTCYIDFTMEEHVTKLLNESFKDSLMLTIAHKVSTIMSSDKILVLDHGEVKEFDSPQNLLKDSQSLFYGIINLINQNRIN
ncbi:hypothetical protein ABPG72_018347 [Tetrahymena utriculariae]